MLSRQGALFLFYDTIYLAEKHLVFMFQHSTLSFFTPDLVLVIGV